MSASLHEELLVRSARLDAVPPGWRLATVGEVCSIRNDLRKPISREERKGMRGIYPYYGPTGVLDHINEYRLDDTYALIGEDGDHFLEYTTKQQTQLVKGKANVNNHAHVIGSTAQCTAEWFFNFFRHRNITDFLSRQGAGRYKLNKETLGRLPILVPPLDVQEVVSNVISIWDTAIEKNEQIILAKEQRHAGLLQLLISTGKARHHWETVELGSIVTERTEKSVAHDQYPVMTSSRRGLFLQSEYFTKQVTSEDNSSYKVMRRGDFTFRSMSDDGHFAFNRLTTLDAGIVSPAYSVFYANGCYAEFLAHFLNSSHFANALNRESQGGTRKALRFSAIAQIDIDLPSLPEQERIAGILDASLGEIEIEKKRLALLKEQKRGLMQNLLTGHWRVKVPEGAEVA